MRDEVQKIDTPAPATITPSHGTRPRHLGLIVLAALLAVAGLAAYGALGHALRQQAALETEKLQEDAVPLVRIAAVGINSAPRVLDLPGSTEAFDAATVYARATGYIAKRHVDIGSKVKVGDVLALIAAPDLDQQLLQAQAQVAQLKATVTQAQSNMQLANVTNQRTQTLVGQGWQSKQQGDTDRLTYQGQSAAVQVAQANLLAGEAQVSRLMELTGFEKVVAPFDGFITQRHIDVGSLVTADQSTGTALFDIARSEVLRTQIYVPQDAVFSLKNGEQAEISPCRNARARSSSARWRATQRDSPGTRTRLTEVDVDNADGTLFPGRLLHRPNCSLPRAAAGDLRSRPQALIFNKNGLSAAVYRRRHRPYPRHLNLLADNGAEVDVRTGLEPEDKIILNPPINIRDGMRVMAAGSGRQFMSAAPKSRRSRVQKKD